MLFEMVMVVTAKLLQDCVHTNVSEGQNASIFRVEDENQQAPAYQNTQWRNLKPKTCNKKCCTGRQAENTSATSTSH